MKPIKLIKHIREVGFKNFKKEYKEGKIETEADPLVNLKMQLVGYIGVILFSLGTMGVFIWKGMWYIAGIFLFNCLIQYSSLRNTKSQIKMIKEMTRQEQELIEESNAIEN